jgi:Sulfotransferase domain
VRIARFLNISCTDEALQKIVKNCSINEMRETSNFGLNHLRQGGFGGWRGLFTVALSEFFDDVSAAERSDPIRSQ